MYGQYKEKIDLGHSGSEKYSEENGVLIILREQFSTAEYHIGVSV